MRKKDVREKHQIEAAWKSEWPGKAYPRFDRFFLRDIAISPASCKARFTAAFE
jgi:hypothetical protein